MNLSAMTPIIQKASEEHLEEILSLVKQHAIFEREPHAVTATIDDYQKAFREGLIDIHIALIDNKVIGIALYYMNFSTWRGHMLYLEELFVTEGYRSLGIGQLLFDAFVLEAKEKNCKLVLWEVAGWNDKAIKFYKKNGATIENQWRDCKIVF